MTIVVKRYNDEVIVSSGTEQEAIQQLLENYNFTVETTDEEIVEFEGANILASRKQEILNARAEQEKQARIAEIKKQLEAIDLKSIRAIRASETERIAQYENEAQELRTQLQELQNEEN